MSLPILRLKKGEDRRLREGHLWIYSNEIDTRVSNLKQFKPGTEVIVENANQTTLGLAYINPHSLISARLFSRHLNDHLDTPLFKQRLHQALSLREQLFAEPYYRLVFGEGDQLPGLVIDRYGEHLVVQINTFGMELKKVNLIEALQEVVPQLKSILWRNDSSIRLHEGLGSYVEAAWGRPPETTLIKENDTPFQLPLWQGQKTGWFYDHRFNRARLKSYVADKTVLDVFSYLGAWGIQATHFGAKQVHCIDSSALACEWIKKNAQLNGVEKKLSVDCAEAIPALHALHQAKRKFEVIVLDPPAFIKKRKDQKEGLVAYQRLNMLALRLLAPGGIFISGSCSMHLAEEDLLRLGWRSGIQARCQLQLLEKGHQGPDHPIHPAIPETAYLKALFFRGLSI